MTDPLSPRAHEGSPGPPTGEQPDLPPEILSEVFERVLRQHYADTATEPVPTLGDRAPRDLVGGPNDEKLLRHWLDSLQTNERENAERMGRPEIDLGFLWEAVGLDRPAERDARGS